MENKKAYSSWEALSEAVAEGNWTLFLDRDGTINKRLIGQYVSNTDDFAFLPDAIQGLKNLQNRFLYMLVVTNQQGISKEIMTHEQLSVVHNFMLKELEGNGVYLDQIYYSPDLADTDSSTRKPAPGMGLQAQQDFENIDFSRSIMVGDSPSDMKFGRTLGMITIWISNEELIPFPSDVDFQVTSLQDLALFISNK